MAMSYHFIHPFKRWIQQQLFGFYNSEFEDESIKKMLGADTIKESLTKSKVINPLSVSTKKRLRP